MDLPGGSDDKESAFNSGDPGSVPGSGNPPGEGILLDRGAWQATYSPWSCKALGMTERLTLLLSRFLL